MRVIKSLGCLVSLSLAAGCIGVAPATANSYSDITGTNIWNNTAPGGKAGVQLPPGLLDRISQINQQSEQAFQACDAAITQAEQIPTTRRFARRPSTQTAQVPAACQRLEALRTEADSLRQTVQELERSGGTTAFQAW